MPGRAWGGEPCRANLGVLFLPASFRCTEGKGNDPYPAGGRVAERTAPIGGGRGLCRSREHVGQARPGVGGSRSPLVGARFRLADVIGTGQSIGSTSWRGAA